MAGPLAATMVGGRLEKDNLSSSVNDIMTIGLVSRSAKF